MTLVINSSVTLAWYFDEVQTPAGLAAVRHSVRRGTPFGQAPWVQRIVRDLGLEFTVGPRGRPRKAE